MNLRQWATPLVVGTFLVSGVTGILMFLHLSTGLNKPAHEWIGLAMVAAVLVHLVVNWRAFTTYFKRPLGLVIMGLGVVVLGLSFVSIGGGGTDGPGAAVEVMVARLSTAPLTQLADLAGKDPAALLDEVNTLGAGLTSTDQSLGDVPGADPRQTMALLGVALASPTN